MTTEILEVIAISGARAELLWQHTYPDIEIQVAICDRLDIESNGRNCGNNFANLET